jgi:hypothetical protein
MPTALREVRFQGAKRKTHARIELFTSQHPIFFLSVEKQFFGLHLDHEAGLARGAPRAQRRFQPDEF